MYEIREVTEKVPTASAQLNVSPKNIKEIKKKLVEVRKMIIGHMKELGSYE